MKKIIFIFICFLSGIYLAKAASLVSEDLPYFAKVSKGNFTQIIRIKKVYDKDTSKVVFNVNPNNYDISNNFNIYEDYSFETWKIPDTSIGTFNTITYYGYLNNPSDLNYFITQIIIWSSIFNYTVKITDQDGNVIDDYQKVYNKIFNDIYNPATKSPFFYQKHNYEIWTDQYFSYMPNTIILDNPMVDGLFFSNEERVLSIYNEKIGNYSLTFKKEYEHENYSYSDGVNVFLQNLKDPNDICYQMDYNVYGTKINIQENLIGVDNRFGDAKLKSKYELYLDDELKLVVDNSQEIYVKSNSNYILKDISNTNGINNVDEINFEVLNDELTVVIDKYVISKNISLNIETNKNYYVYLKSSDELYETINSKTDVITLPYGNYYIKDEENKYFKELIVDDDIDEVLTIKYERDDEIEKEELPNEEEKDVVIESPITNERIEINDETIIEEIDNPKTIDNINVYKLSFIFSALMLWLFLGVAKLID